MKIQIDTELKTIKIDEGIKLGEFTDKIRKLLPDWKEYMLMPDTITYWTNPVIYQDPIPSYPWWEQPPTICDSGVYNIELQ